jgi:hypothetical protein
MYSPIIPRQIIVSDPKNTTNNAMEVKPCISILSNIFIYNKEKEYKIEKIIPIIPRIDIILIGIFENEKIPSIAIFKSYFIV